MNQEERGPIWHSLLSWVGRLPLALACRCREACNRPASKFAPSSLFLLFSLSSTLDFAELSWLQAKLTWLIVLRALAETKVDCCMESDHKKERESGACGVQANPTDAFSFFRTVGRWCLCFGHTDSWQQAGSTRRNGGGPPLHSCVPRRARSLPTGPRARHGTKNPKAAGRARFVRSLPDEAARRRLPAARAKRRRSTGSKILCDATTIHPVVIWGEPTDRDGRETDKAKKRPARPRGGWLLCMHGSAPDQPTSKTKASFRYEIFLFRYRSICVCLYQILSNHKLTRIKNSSHDLQTNCVISFYFRLYLVFHACAAKFDVTGNFKNFLDFGGK